jgi:hypothetical protein
MKGMDQLEDISEDGRIMLKRIIKKKNARM